MYGHSAALSGGHSNCRLRPRQRTFPNDDVRRVISLSRHLSVDSDMSALQKRPSSSLIGGRVTCVAAPLAGAQQLPADASFKRVSSAQLRKDVSAYAWAKHATNLHQTLRQ